MPLLFMFRLSKGLKKAPQGIEIRDLVGLVTSALTFTNHLILSETVHMNLTFIKVTIILIIFTLS